jgi:GntR family transcriptional regulator
MQVQEILMHRIGAGIWKPGDMLPSEFELADDLGASQGTVRKALDRMETENLIVRVQGRGTFVARHDDARILFQFFKLAPDLGEPHFPESRVIDVQVIAADKDAMERLQLNARAKIIRLERVRSLADQTCIIEQISLPFARFAGLEKSEIPNNLYERYRSRFAVTITRALEHLKAVAATKREAKYLSVEVGAPLLSIDRIAFDIDGAPTEWRQSICDTRSIHYVSNLR